MTISPRPATLVVDDRRYAGAATPARVRGGALPFDGASVGGFPLARGPAPEVPMV